MLSNFLKLLDIFFSMSLLFQGRSLLEASLHTFPSLERQGMTGLSTELPHCHHAVLHGAIMGGLGLGLEDTISSFVFGIVRTLVATAVRLDVLGAMEVSPGYYKQLSGIKLRLYRKPII